MQAVAENLVCLNVSQHHISPQLVCNVPVLIFYESNQQHLVKLVVPVASLPGLSNGTCSIVDGAFLEIPLPAILHLDNDVTVVA